MRELAALDVASFSKGHHRPVGVDGDVGAVVVEDGASAVDDFLVALDLRHDLLLHLQRRQGNLEVLDVIAGHALQPARAGHLCDSGIPKERMHDAEVNPLGQDLAVGP